MTVDLCIRTGITFFLILPSCTSLVGHNNSNLAKIPYCWRRYETGEWVAKEEPYIERLSGAVAPKSNS